MKHTKSLLLLACAMLTSCGEKENTANNDEPQEVRIVSDKTEEEAHAKWQERQNEQFEKNKRDSDRQEQMRKKREEESAKKREERRKRAFGG